MAGIISKGIKLAYKTGTGSTFTTLTNLQEIPELGGDVEAIETTTLNDAAHTYTDGILNYGDSLAFKFLYEPAQFAALAGVNDTATWKVTLPDGAGGADGSTCQFEGTCSVKLDGVGVNAVLTYTLSVKPSSAMAWTSAE